MNETLFLEWIRDRIINVYGESPDVDFVRRLSEIIDRLKKAENEATEETK